MPKKGRNVETAGGDALRLRVGLQWRTIAGVQPIRNYNLRHNPRRDLGSNGRRRKPPKGAKVAGMYLLCYAPQKLKDATTIMHVESQRLHRKEH
jgi:hypothetical protein